MKTRTTRPASGERSMGSCHRNLGWRLVIAGFRVRLSRRPLRPGRIFRFCDISRVCGQENFPSIFAPRWPSRAGRSGQPASVEPEVARPRSRCRGRVRGSGSVLRSIAVPLQECAILSGIAAWNGRQRGTTRPSTAMGRRGPGRGEISRRAVTGTAPLAEGTSYTDEHKSWLTGSKIKLFSQKQE